MNDQNVTCADFLVKAGAGHVFKGFEKAPKWAVREMRRALTGAAPVAVEAARPGRLQSLRRRPHHGRLHHHPGGAEVAPAIERDRADVAADDQLMRLAEGRR